MTRRVPANRVTAWTTQPRKDETFLSWFDRYAFLQDSTPQMFARFLGIDQMPTPRSLWGVYADDETIDYLAAVSRNEVDALRSVEYGTCSGNLTPLGKREVSSWFVARWVRFCPECFREDGYWRAGWEHGWNNVCLDHECLLEWCCPSCSAVRRGVFDTRTSNHFDPSSCHECGHRFASTAATAASPTQVATQHRVAEFAAAGSGWGRFVDAVRCLTACQSSDVDTGRCLSPFGLPVAPKVALAVADRALDAVTTVDGFEELLFSSMDTATNLARDGVRVSPDIRPVLRKYVHGQGSRHVVGFRSEAQAIVLKTSDAEPILTSRKQG